MTDLTKKEKKQLDSMSFSKALKINPKVLNPKIVRRGRKIRKARQETSILKLVIEQYKNASSNEKKTIKQGIFWSVTNGVLSGSLPILMGNTVTALQSTAAQAKLWICSTEYIGGMVISAISRNKMMLIMNKIGQQIKANTVVRKFKETLNRPLQFFRLKDNNTRNLQSRINNIANAQTVIMNENMKILNGISGITVSGAILLTQSPVMFGVICGGTAMMVGLSNFFASRHRQQEKIIREKSEQTNSTIYDLQSKADVLKRYKQKDKSINIVDHSLRKFNLFSEKFFELSSKLDITMNTIISIGIFSSACYIGAKTSLDSGQLGAFATITGASMGFLTRSLAVVQSLRRMKESVYRYIDENKKLQIPHWMNIKSGEKQLNADNSKIEIKNVSFEYPDYSRKKTDKDYSEKKNSFQIENMNTTFEKGLLQVIIGKSGNGKSTLIDLMTHIYDIDEGEITIGGVNIAETTEQELMNYVGIMTQKDIFFDSMSISKNLEMLIPSDEDLDEARIKKERGEISAERYNYMCELHDHPKEKIDEALKKAKIYDTYYQEQPNGDPNYEKGFTEFSGGEQQRLTFARAILAQKEIIILDEPTSALDAGLSMELVTELKEIAKDKNVIVVTHAADVVANADKVTVIEKGKITGDDNVFELLRSNDYFKKNYSIPSILEARKKYLKCAGKETYDIKQKILFQQKVDAAYSELKTELEHNPKEFINKIKNKVKSFHECKKADDEELMVMKKVLDTPEMQKAYVSASKEALKKRIYTNKVQRN